MGRSRADRETRPDAWADNVPTNRAVTAPAYQDGGFGSV